jgi:predicted RecA/RadA family phage recombinase
MKFGSVVSVLALSGVSTQPNPKPKPPPKPTPPPPVLSNDTAVYLSGSESLMGTLSGLDLGVFGDVVNEHISVSMKSRFSVIALPDVSSAGLFAFSEEAADWVSTGTVSYASDSSVQSAGDVVGSAGSLAAVGVTSSYAVFLNETCSQLYDCAALMDSGEGYGDVANNATSSVPWCCEDLQVVTEVGVHLYDMSDASFLGALSWGSNLAQLLGENQSLAEVCSSVSMDISSGGMVAVGASWKTQEGGGWATGLLFLTPVAAESSRRYTALTHCVLISVN